ncbi:MAG: DAHL domain-containing protein [Gallionella sp.]
MNRYLHPIPLAILSLLLISGLGFIYWKSETFIVTKQTQITDNLRRMEQLDAEWNLDVWRAKDGVTNESDHANSPQAKLMRLKTQISAQLSPMGNAALNQQDADLQNLISKKLDLIETFKSQSEVLTTSLKSLPAANATLQQLIADEKNKNAARAPALSSMGELADKLLTETLKYNLAPNADQKLAVEQNIGLIEASESGNPKPIIDQIDVLLNHARTVLRQKEREDTLLKSINALAASQQTTQIDNILSEEYGGRLKMQQKYRNYLFAYSGLLLALLAYAGYKLVGTVRDINAANTKLNNVNEELHATNASLDKQVVARTQMVTQAMEELKESQVQLVQSEKMASIGQMVAGVTHEINTPLSYVKSGLEIAHTRVEMFAELINESVLLNTMLESGQMDEEMMGHQLQRIGEVSKTLSEGDVVQELSGLLDDGLHGIDQISEIVVGLKNFSRVDREKVVEFNVHDGLDVTLKIARNIVKHKTIVKQYGENISMITCSPSAINQVFLNLISNAAQATGDDGEIRLVTAQQGQFVRIDIIDNGSGIPEEALNKIFEPFFTTKKIGEGTGLGLSIVKRIIKEHGGNIKVQSKLGMGTKFTILLPVEIAPPPPKPKKATT